MKLPLLKVNSTLIELQRLRRTRTEVNRNDPSTRSEDIINVLNRIVLSKRLEVVEVSSDMASHMRKAREAAFPNASLVIDRFHVVRLIMDAMQHARIDQRWKEIDKENEAIQKARRKGTRNKPLIQY